MNDYREKEFLTVQEIADILRMGKSKCYDWTKSIDCPFNVIRLGSLIRIPTNNFYKWYDSLAEKQKQERKRG